MKAIHKKLIPAAALFAATCFAGITSAQDETDVLRYSYLSPQGTARSIGFGNVLGSVGGDISTLSINPAGIGIYRSSELLITPGIRFNSTDGSYLGTSATESNTRFNLNNLGAVFTGQGGRKSDWKTFSFGLGVNRVADFNRDYTYNGWNGGDLRSSITELFVADADGYPDNVEYEGTPAWFGYQSFLLDFDEGSGYYTNVPWQDGIRQQRFVKERGGMNEYFLSFGGNYREQLMLGVTMGIPSIRYTREASFHEVDEMNYSPVFDNLAFSEKLTTSGIGINAKIGFIYKPVDAFRFGGAIHTPTAFAMSEVYEQSLSANTEGYAEGGDYILIGPRNEFNYGMTTPWRGVLSATGMMGKMGFVSIDYEFVDYRSARLRFRTDDITWAASYRELESQINQSIRNAYQAASNVRLGGEVRLEPVMLRAGVGYYGSPYKNFSGGDRLDFSAGLGFRFDQVFLDLGFRHSRFQNEEQPYVLPYEGVMTPIATLKNSHNNVAVTLGFKF